MIIKIENKNPKITFLTTNGNRTPKEIWKDEETDVKGFSKKSVIAHTNRLKRMGITKDMTDYEAIKQANKYLKELIKA